MAKRPTMNTLGCTTLSRQPQSRGTTAMREAYAMKGMTGDLLSTIMTSIMTAATSVAGS